MLGAARVAYACHALASGWIAVAIPDPGVALLAATAGGLALSAAAWVTSEDRLRGALASIGIVVGALPVAAVVGLSSVVTAYFGGWPWAVGSGVALLVVAAMAALTWRVSRRPWDRGQPATAR